MNIRLDPSIEKAIAAKVRSGEFANPDQVIEQALRCFIDLDQEDLEDAAQAIEEAREQSRRGESVSAESVFAGLRARHGIQR